jgi:hypothetical protein
VSRITVALPEFEEQLALFGIPKHRFEAARLKPGPPWRQPTISVRNSEERAMASLTENSEGPTLLSILWIRTLILTLAWLDVCSAAPTGEVYRNEFNDAPGTSYAEWTATRGQTPMVVEAANGSQRFLGEFGGEKLVNGPPFVRVDQTVSLRLKDLPPHQRLTIEFDLYILKSWDGDNPNYGPDRWKLRVAGGPVLLETTFSNNHKSGGV